MARKWKGYGHTRDIFLPASICCVACFADPFWAWGLGPMGASLISGHNVKWRGLGRVLGGFACASGVEGLGCWGQRVEGVQRVHGMQHGRAARCTLPGVVVLVTSVQAVAVCTGANAGHTCLCWFISAQTGLRMLW